MAFVGGNDKQKGHKMLTLYYCPQTRATRIIGLLMMMEHLDDVTVKTVDIQRRDGSGGHDPANPHPEGKVPFLVHDGEIIRESSAIILYLTDHFGGPMGRDVGEKGRGEYLSWLAYYGDVIEPVMALQFLAMDPAFSGVLEHPTIKSTFRGLDEIKATLRTALADKPFLLGDTFTAADLLMVSPYQWMPQATPDDPNVKAWVKRATDVVNQTAVAAYEAAAMKELGLA